MARRSTKSSVSPEAAAGPPDEAASAPAGVEKPVRMDTVALDIEALASVILAREVRPRVGDVRRLAEAVLRRARKKKANKARKGVTKGERKLSKIPARKGKK